MASQKEEPTASFLFGDSAGDDPFSQLQQQQQPTPPKEEQPVATKKKVAGDASSLFDNSTAGVDLFFSSTAATANTTPQSAYPPTTNASSFFDQSQGTGSFFDDLNQQQPVSLTQAYDPTTYSQQEGIEAYVPNGYQQGAEAQAYDQQQQQQQQEWVEFDPNVHYYYDEQGGVHYYDPNTNQEYDMSQYGYDYQYDPQYAEYYSQQEYDPNAYAQQQQVYDTNTYAPVTQDQTENSYFDYSHQPREVTPTDNAVAKVPAQVQSEQTLDTQQYQQGDQYGSQQQNYQTYEPVSTETVSVDRYAPAEYNTQATDLQVQVPPLDIKDNGPSPSAPPQKAIVTLPSLPRSSAMSPGAQISSHRGSFDAKANSEMDQSPSKFVQEDLNDLDDLVFGGNKQPQVEDLDDLFGIDNNQDQKVPEIHHEADSILFGSELEQTTQEVASKPKEQDCSFAYELTENKKEEHQVEQHEDEQPSEDNAQAEQHAIISEESNHSAAFESQEANYEHQQASQETGKAFTQVPGFENQDHINYESVNQKASQGNYESEQAIDYSPQLSEYGTQETAKYESQQSTYEAQEDVNHEPPQTDSYGSQEVTSYEPQQAASYEPYQTAKYEPQQSAYEPQQTTSYESQQTVSYEPGQSTEYEPQPLTGYEPEPSDYEPRYAVTLHEPQPAASREILRPPPTKYPSMPPAFPPAASIKSVSSPPPFSTMPPPRSNSITEPDRHQMTSPFRMIERSATVPPPMTERIASPRPQLVPCPDPACEGENKVKAKFCCECGRPLAGISRSTTPSAATMSSYDVMTFTRPQDEKKDACKTSLDQFLKTITGDVEERRRLVLNYIQGRLGEFEESKALLWKLVELMIQHHEDALGDGGQLDKSIIGLLSSHSPAGINDLDQLESMLAQGDRQSACQFAVEHDMWAHALIIASIDPDQFKHIITQFIDRGLYTSQLEWKPQIADNKKSLRMLYSVFNGTGAASVAQFVKNAVEEEPMYTQKTLEGWKDALALVLANRSMNDQEAIHGLGNQLEQAGLTNESQLCYLLSPDLLGLGTAWSADLDSLYLYELYEFGLNSRTTIPQQFKLLLAWWLSDLGFNQESRKYVDSIVSVISLTDASNVLQSFKELAAQDFPEIQYLLNKQTLDTLIASVENAINNQGSYQSSYNQDYGSSYQPVSEKAVTTPFGQQAKGIESPFGGYIAPAESSGAWWNNPADTALDNNQPESYQPESYQPESYQPDAYTPAPTTSYQANNEDDDDLGFGNSKPKKAEEKKPEEQKPNQITEEKEEKKTEVKPASGGSGWGLFSLFSRKEKDGDEKKPVEANLGEKSSFYYDEKEKRWVNKLNDSKPAAATPPPPPKSTTPQPVTNTSAPPAPPAPPLSAIKPNNMPPSRINSAPPPTAVSSLGSPLPAGFSTPPPTAGRRAGGARKPMRSRYVDVLNPPS